MMDKNKLAVLNFLNEPYFFMSILNALGPERVVFYCLQTSRRHLSWELAEIAALGVEIVYLDSLDIWEPQARHDWFLCDILWIYKARAKDDSAALKVVSSAISELVLSLKKDGKHFICTSYSVDVVPSEQYLWPDDFFICPCESLFYQSIQAGEYLIDSQDGWPQVGRNPGGWTTALIGPLHINQFFVDDYQVATKAKQELARHLNVDFQVGRPLISTTITGTQDESSFIKGLAHFSKHTDIAIKAGVKAVQKKAPISGELSCKMDNHQADQQWLSRLKEAGGTGNFYFVETPRLNNLSRLAADLTLADPLSGGALTCLFLGVRFCLAYTQKCRWKKIDLMVNYSHELRRAHSILNRLAYAVMPMPIEATEMLLERLVDESYWKRFEQERSRLLESVTGRFFVGREASARVAFYIKQALDYGGIWPSEEEIRERGLKLKSGAAIEIKRPPLDLTL